MPIYSLACEPCVTEEDVYLPLFTSPNPECSKCGAPRSRVWRSRSSPASSVFPYVTTHLNGQPIEVRSEMHLQELCKAHGVVHRPDAAWVEKSVEATGKGPKWREGNGVGSPGCWV